MANVNSFTHFLYTCPSLPISNSGFIHWMGLFEEENETRKFKWIAPKMYPTMVIKLVWDELTVKFWPDPKL